MLLAGTNPRLVLEPSPALDGSVEEKVMDVDAVSKRKSKDVSCV